MTDPTHAAPVPPSIGPRSRRPVRAALLLAAAGLVLASPGEVQAQRALDPSVQALNDTLQAARDAFSRAYVAGEFDVLAAMYVPDAILLPTIGTIQGRDAIQEFFTYGPGRVQVAHSMMPTTLSVEGSTAVETGVWSSTVQVGDNPPRTASGRHILVWRRQPDGRWLIAHDAWHQPPSRRPEPTVVGAGTVSLDGRNETWPAVDPVDGSLWFSVYSDDFDAQRLYRSERADGGWGPAAPVAWSDGRYGDRAPRFALDGSALYFTSTRPVPGRPDGDLDIWVVERGSDGWGAPRPVPAPVSSDGRDMHATATADGDLFVASDRPGSAGRTDLLRVPAVAGSWGEAAWLPAVINDERSQPDALVAPDGSWLIVVVTDHPSGLGGDDLFLARRTSTGWTPLEHLPAPVNSEAYEYGPSLSPDGDTVYFTSHRRGSADLFAIPIRALGLDPAG
jgi:ketosteroid isomerase-like protein